MSRCLVFFLMLFICDNAFGGLIVSVPGTANPYLADPANVHGSNGSVLDGTAPPFIGVVGVSYITFNNTEGFSHTGGTPSTGPDGFGTSTANTALHGISGWNYLLDSLLGVFLDPTNVGAAPAALPVVSNFTVISPLRGQVFFIGDGLTGTGSGTLQRFNVPVGATRLYFASRDAFGWFNNTGIVTVNATLVSAAVPEPSSFCLMGLCMAAMACCRRTKTGRTK